MRLPFLSILVLLLSSSSAQVPELNKKMLKYAKRQVGIKVGKGVCWELVYQALRFSRAKMGDTVCFENVQPGDIVYTGEHLLIINGFTPATELPEEAARDRDSIPNIVELWSHPHIGIVGEIFKDGRFEMYEQNVQGAKRKSHVVCNRKDIYNWIYDSTTVLPIVYFDWVFIRPTKGYIIQDLVQYGCRVSKTDKLRATLNSTVRDIESIFTRGFKPSDPIICPGESALSEYLDVIMENECLPLSDYVYSMILKEPGEVPWGSELDSIILNDDFVVDAKATTP